VKKSRHNNNLRNSSARIARADVVPRKTKGAIHMAPFVRGEQMTSAVMLAAISQSNPAR
jgi:hypothetical protein